MENISMVEEITLCLRLYSFCHGNWCHYDSYDIGHVSLTKAQEVERLYYEPAHLQGQSA